MANFSSNFDSMWQNYTQGNIGPIEFLEGSRKGGGISKFAEWAEEKIREATLQPASLKKLVDELSPIDSDASKKIHKVFMRVKEQDSDLQRKEKRPPPAAPTRKRKAADLSLEPQSKKVKLPFLDVWNECKKGNLQPLNTLTTELHEFIEFVEKKSETDTKGNFLLVFLKDAQEIVPDERAEFIKVASSLFQGIDNENQKEAILDYAREIDSDKRVAFLKQAIFLFQGISDEDQIDTLIDAVRELDPNHSSEAIGQATPILKDTKDGYTRAAILEAINEFDSEEKGKVIRQATPLLKGISERKELISILETVQDTKAISTSPDTVSTTFFLYPLAQT